MTEQPDLDALLTDAKRLSRERNYSDAISQFRKIIAWNEDHSAAHDGMAAAAFLAGDLPTAIEHFTRVTRLEPMNAKPLINLGAALNRAERYKEAVEALRKAIQRDPKSAQAYYNMGIAHRRLNQSSMAVSAYREALRLDPNMAEAHQNLANVLRDLGQHKQSITHYRKALEIDPNLERARTGLAEVENRQAQAALAISPFGRLVSDPSAAAKEMVQINRELTEEERIHDRSTLAIHARQIEQVAKTLLAQLKSDLEPSVLGLERAFGQAGIAPGVLITAHENYQAAFARTDELRKKLKRRVLELRGHEELINTPEINLT